MYIFNLMSEEELQFLVVMGAQLAADADRTQNASPRLN